MWVGILLESWREVSAMVGTQRRLLLENKLSQHLECHIRVYECLQVNGFHEEICEG
eukprot:c7190_g2_i1 orf=96-263(+)